MPTKAELEAENEALKADLVTIAERLREEAVNREWCTDYDDVMTDLNGQTSQAWMRPCSTEVRVRVQGTVEIRFSDLQVDVSTVREDGPNNGEIVDAIHEWVRENVTREHYPLDGPGLVTIAEAEPVGA